MQFSYFLDSRLRGNDTLGLVRQENGRLLHWAKMLLLFWIPACAGMTPFSRVRFAQPPYPSGKKGFCPPSGGLVFGVTSGPAGLSHLGKGE